MLKRSLIALAVVAMLVSCVNAGEIKTHCWPTQFVELEITTIPVVVDIGYYIRIKDQNKLGIKVTQKSDNFKTFEGCLNKDGVNKMTVQANFDLVLTASFSLSGVSGDRYVALDGTWSGKNGSVSKDYAAGENKIDVCVRIENADLYSMTDTFAPGTKNVPIGSVTIKVKPQGSSCCNVGPGGSEPYSGGSNLGQSTGW